MNERTITDCAIRYASYGWQVIPVEGKKPVGNNWQKRATNDQEKAAKEFATNHHDGIGVQLGQLSDLIDFDCDSPEAEETLCRLFDGFEVPSPSFKSARGRHVLFRWTDKLPQGSIKIVVDGLEIRLGNGSAGCQSVFPPSGSREWLIHPDDCPLPEIPSEVIERINTLYAEARKPKAIEKKGFEAANPATGDDVLNVPKWLAKHGREVLGKTEGKDGVTRWHIECPGIASHNTENSWRDCCVTQDVTGKLGGCCFHSSCGLRSWEDLKNAIGVLEWSDYHDQAESAGVDCRQKEVDTPALAAKRDHSGPNADEWQELIPLTEDFVDELPVDAVPLSVRPYLVQLSEFSQTPFDLAFGMWLAAVAIAVQKKFVVHCGWYEQLSLYVLALMEPANRKSAVVSAIADPIRQYEYERRQALAPVIREARVKSEVKIKQRNRLTDEAAKAQFVADREMMLHELKQLDEEIANDQIPSEPTFLADDVTPEHMATLMAQNNGRLGVLTAEGDLFDILNGRYSGKPNIGIVLKSHSGDEVRVNRGNRPSELIRHPALSMGFSAQPDVLRGLLEQKQFRGRGLMGRLLFQIPKSLLGQRKMDANAIDPFVGANYQNLMLSILSMPVAEKDGEFVPETISFSPEATSLFRAFRQETELAFLEFGALSQIKDWGGKLIGAVARIAGLFHIADHALQQPIPSLISRDTIANAIRIGKYFTSHARTAFQIMGQDENRGLAELIACTIKRHRLASFTRRDIHQHVRRNVTKPDDLDEPLRLLADHCFIREREQPKATRGRRPSSSYETNPQLLNA